MSNKSIPQAEQADGNVALVHDPLVYELIIKMMKEIRAMRIQIDEIVGTESSVEDIEIEE